MTLLARILIVFLSLLLLGGWLLKRLFAAASKSAQPAAKRQSAIQGQMLKDPQCGIYVASSLALSHLIGGKEYHFCSAKCRDEFLAREASSARPRAQSH